MSENTHKISGAFVHLGHKLKSKVNNKFLTYLVFLVIAVIIWYLNALNKDYNAELKFKVKYVNFPEDKVLVKAPQNYLMLTVNAQGFTILKYRLGLIFYPLAIDANYQTLRRGDVSHPDEYLLATQSVSDRVAEQLNSDVRLRHISPDTLRFTFSETIKKSISVKAMLQLQFEKEFLPVGAMQIEPSAVVVSGPHAIVDTMQYVYTKSKSFKKLKDTLRVEIDLLPVEQLKYSVTEVNATQPIERHTEATVVIPIEPVNLPDDLKMKTFPGTVTVSCMVPINSFEKFQPYMFRATVDYNAIRDAKDNQTKARVVLVKTPEYVSDVRFQPKNVEYIIEK